MSAQKEPYKPTAIPIKKLDWESLIPRIGMAQAAVARFDGILQAMVNPELLLSPLTTQEAVLSSKIEGTQASLEDERGNLARHVETLWDKYRLPRNVLQQGRDQTSSRLEAILTTLGYSEGAIP